MTTTAKQRRQTRLLVLKRELLADDVGGRLDAAEHWNGRCKCQRAVDRSTLWRRFVAWWCS